MDGIVSLSAIKTNKYVNLLFTSTWSGNNLCKLKLHMVYN